MIYIQISDTISTAIEPSILETAAQETLRYAKTPADVDLTIVLTGDEQLHKLNLQFLGVDAPTDVLSFPASDPDPDTNCPYLGDILISVERAQAQTVGHSIQDELQLLVVHGVLHLLGYDHAEEGEKAEMWEIQKEVLKKLGNALAL
jgi:probable rRNA maturation factor